MKRQNYLAGPVELYWAKLHTGDIHSPFPTLEEASKHVYSANENAARIQNKDRFIIGEYSDGCTETKTFSKRNNGR